MAAAVASVGAQKDGKDGLLEALSCVTCRSRKLRCDRIKPTCTRCSKLKNGCVYPESRRKPVVKRRNVKELEERLAQVEVLLKETTGSGPVYEQKTFEDFNFNLQESGDVYLQGLDIGSGTLPNGLESTFSMPETAEEPVFTTPFEPLINPNPPIVSGEGFELVDLGFSESLPPPDMIDELHKLFFEREAHAIPYLHPRRYIQAFYSPPHMRPPMSLQYSVWALACNGNAKYGSYHEIFYLRARQYAEADEMKGYGEHFITVAHAQAWGLIATDEAKSMLFTRGAMSAARAIRLCQIMGLHRLDSPIGEVSETLMPPVDWAELEERRRTFWGAFCFDSHCSLATGWPQLIDISEVSTNLPAPEAAFHSGEAVDTCDIHSAFKGHTYSTFAGAVLICYLFNQILKHANRPKPNDNPEDYEYGPFWQRHREIDNRLSSAFMFLPELFRLPEQSRNPGAVQMNLNLHAAVICLHHAALDKIDAHDHPASAKKASQDRLTASADEIVHIMKLASQSKSQPKSPLCALSLYCAVSVYIYMSSERGQPLPSSIDNLNYLVQAMTNIGREHFITRSVLKQVVADIEHHDLTAFVRIPDLASFSPYAVSLAANVPLLVRSRISRHTEMQPPLPGRLPLGNPKGTPNPFFRASHPGAGCVQGLSWGPDEEVHSASKAAAAAASSNKRRRMSNQDTPSSSDLSPAESVLNRHDSSDSSAAPQQDRVYNPFTQSNSAFPGFQQSLPHRTGSPAASSMGVQTGPADKSQATTNGGRMVDWGLVDQAVNTNMGNGNVPILNNSWSFMGEAGSASWGNGTSGGNEAQDQMRRPDGQV